MHFKKVKGILSAKNGMNIYRGCTHGCIYCDSRSKCYNMDHDFEDIQVKINAPELLEDRLRRKREKCMIGTGSMSDPYIGLESELGYTRKCLEIINKHGFGLAILTKSNRILRDLDLLKAINEKAKCVVQITLTTYDEELCKIVEPNVSTTKERVEVLKILHQEQIPTVVWFGPLLPFINDTEQNLRGILDYCIDAHVYGILCFGISLTLREGNREYFYRKLDQFFPGLKEKYHKKYGYNYVLNSDNNKQLMTLFKSICKKHGIVSNTKELFQYMNTFEQKKEYEQMMLFD